MRIVQDVKGFAHVTGGGIGGNLKRILPEGVTARVHAGAWPELPSVRVFPLDRFPFLIPYVVRERELVVLALAHGKRRPGYWRVRVGEGES